MRFMTNKDKVLAIRGHVTRFISIFLLWRAMSTSHNSRGLVEKRASSNGPRILGQNKKHSVVICDSLPHYTMSYSKEGRDAIKQFIADIPIYEQFSVVQTWGGKVQSSRAQSLANGF